MLVIQNTLKIKRANKYMEKADILDIKTGGYPLRTLDTTA